MITAPHHLETGNSTETFFEDRILGHLRGKKPGPTVIAIAGMHGNEPSGVEGLKSVFRSLLDNHYEIDGEFVGLLGNKQALAQKVRYIENDLNRLWKYDPSNLVLQDCSGSAEEPEFRSLNQTITHFLQTRRGPVIFIDLHTTSASSAPFLLIGDTLRNRDFVRQFPVPIILGLEETLDGPLLSYINELGHISMGFEAGQHDDPISIENQARMLWLVLERAGCITLEANDRALHFGALAKQSVGSLSFFELRYRHAVSAQAVFRMKPGYVNLQPVAKGEILAMEKNGPVVCPENGRIFMPLYQKQGNDGFFLVRRIAPFWLSVSRFLRRARAENILPLLPGVRRHPNIPQCLRINAKVAFFAPKQILHLLGYRKMKTDGKFLLFVRRPFDRKDPELSHGNDLGTRPAHS